MAKDMTQGCGPFVSKVITSILQSLQNTGDNFERQFP